LLPQRGLEGLNIRPDGIYVDGTQGRADTRWRLQSGLSAGRLIGIDRE
jgi:16S rRNA (cytosine1402-N4)-methyltransferase